jgi:hypothetical protein
MTRFRILPLLALPLAVAACSSDRPDALRAHDAPPVISTEDATVPSPVDGDPLVTDPVSGDDRSVVSPVGAPPASEPAPAPVKAAPKPAPAKPAPRPSRTTTSGGTSSRPRAEIVDDGSSLSTGRWTLRVSLRSGHVVTGTVVADRQLRPTVLGLTDADRDGDDEVFVRVSNGAATSTYVAFTLVEDGMAEVRTPTGSALRLTVGGSVRHGNGFLCSSGSITTLSVTSDDGESYRGSSVTYTWDDDVVTERRRGTFTGRADDPAVRASYGVDCGSIQQD